MPDPVPSVQIRIVGQIGSIFEAIACEIPQNLGSVHGQERMGQAQSRCDGADGSDRCQPARAAAAQQTMEQGFDHVIRMMSGDDPGGSPRLGDRSQMAMPRFAQSFFAWAGGSFSLVREPDDFAREIPAMRQALNKLPIAIAVGASQTMIDMGDYERGLRRYEVPQRMEQGDTIWSAADANDQRGMHPKVERPQAADRCI